MSRLCSLSASVSSSLHHLSFLIYAPIFPLYSPLPLCCNPVSPPQEPPSLTRFSPQTPVTCLRACRKNFISACQALPLLLPLFLLLRHFFSHVCRASLMHLCPCCFVLTCHKWECVQNSDMRQLRERVCLMDGLRGVLLYPFPTRFPLMYNGWCESLAPLFADSNQSARPVE